MFFIDEPQIQRTMQNTGLDRMQAWRHLQQRQHLSQVVDDQRRAALDAALASFTKADEPAKV